MVSLFFCGLLPLSAAAGTAAGIAAGAAARRLFPSGKSCGLKRRCAEGAAGAAFFCFAAAGAEGAAQLAFVWLLAFLLLVHCFTDWDCCLLSDRVTLALVLTGICRSLVCGGAQPALQGAAAAGGAMLAAYFACRGGMGFGDVKLAAALGLWLGAGKSLLMLFLACILGGVPALFLLLLKLRGGGDALPFGPFISIGAMISLLYGDKLLKWYFDFF